MIEKLPVSKIMTETFTSVKPNEKISKVNQIFLSQNINYIPVINNSKILGIVSKKDVLKLGYGINENNQKVLNNIYDTYELDEVMNKNPTTVNSDTKVKEVVQIFKKHNLNTLLVVEKEKIVGIVSKTHIIDYLFRKE